MDFLILCVGPDLFNVLKFTNLVGARNSHVTLERSSSPLMSKDYSYKPTHVFSTCFVLTCFLENFPRGHPTQNSSKLRMLNFRVFMIKLLKRKVHCSDFQFFKHLLNILS